VEPIVLRVIPAEDEPARHLEDAGRRLADELADLPVEIRHATVPAPPGAKTPGRLDFATLLITLLANTPGPGITSMVEIIVQRVVAWVRRAGRYHVCVQLGEHRIELDASAEDRRALVEAFIREASRPTGT
jgi:hypothetical protein